MFVSILIHRGETYPVEKLPMGTNNLSLKQMVLMGWTN
jgi:hypothetical protein